MNNIAILLSTYNGEKYILDQLNSLEDQSYPHFDLFIRDDASKDQTLQIIEKFKSNSQLNIIILPTENNLGAKNSFQSLLTYTVQYKKYQYFMFCDQDDVWFKDKVLLSYQKIQKLKDTCGTEKPLLVYTDLQVVDENLNILGKSLWQDFNLDPKNNSLNYMAMQCNVTGCTMIFNHALVKGSLPFTSAAIMHDYWIAMLATSLGHIDYLNQQTIAYRQHSHNVSGGADKFNFSYISQKAMKFFDPNEFHEVLGRQIIQSESFLLKYKNNLSNDKIEILEAITKLPSVSLLKRVYLVVKYKLYKQGFIRNMGLFLWLIKIPSKLIK